MQAGNGPRTPVLIGGWSCSYVIVPSKEVVRTSRLCGLLAGYRERSFLELWVSTDWAPQKPPKPIQSHCPRSHKATS